VALEFESRAFEEGKTYEIQVQPGISLFGDEEQLKRLTSIFIDNAINYSDERGKIELTLAQTDGGRPLLSVVNTGAGIPEDERQRVFDRFYRSDASRARETGGHGLGLAIAKSIVEQHNGEITLDGQTGSWVRFTVRF
jgi:signal transduction histidine kinase